METYFQLFSTELLFVSISKGKTDYFHPDFTIHVKLQSPDRNGSSYLILNGRHHQGTIIFQIHQIRQGNEGEEKQKEEKSPAA